MRAGVDFEKIKLAPEQWFAGSFLTADTLTQIFIITCAFLIGLALRYLARGRIAAFIDRTEMPVRIRRTAHNLYGLMLPITTLAVIFIVTMLMRGEMVTAVMLLNISVMKLLLAWIIISVCLQFVDNTVLRSLLTLTILAIVALSVFGILDETTAALDAIGFSFGHLRFSALSVLKGILSIFILFYIALFASAFLERKVLKSRTLTRSSQVLTIRILRTSLIIFAIVIGVTSAGIDLSAFMVFAGAIGLGLGFGLQKVVSNLVSGMLLLMDKSINPGDIIELEKTGTYGWVNHITARYTEIVTRENKSYLIPNEDFITQRVVNWSHGSRLIRLDVKFGVHCDSDPRQIIALTIAAARIPSRVVDSPEPTCNFVEFDERALNFVLSFWIKDAEHGVGNIKSEITLALWDSLKANGIRRPGPHRENQVHGAAKG